MSNAPRPSPAYLTVLCGKVAAGAQPPSTSPGRKAWATRRANGNAKPKTSPVTLDQALAIVKAAGYRVSKPAAAPPPKAPAKPKLNAIGKPYSPQFDPNYRVKHKTSTAHLFKPYGDNVRTNLTR